MVMVQITYTTGVSFVIFIFIVVVFINRLNREVEYVRSTVLTYARYVLERIERRPRQHYYCSSKYLPSLTSSTRYWYYLYREDWKCRTLFLFFWSNYGNLLACWYSIISLKYLVEIIDFEPTNHQSYFLKWNNNNDNGDISCLILLLVSTSRCNSNAYIVVK